MLYRSPWIARNLIAMILVAEANGLSAAPLPPLFGPQPSSLDVSNAKVFEEPLVALGNPSPEETKALAMALDAYVAAGALAATQPIQAFLQEAPASPWALSLLVNLGLMQRHTGQITAALASWEAAWALGKTLDSPAGIALAHRALGDLLEANAGLGRRERLEALVQEATARPLRGLITEKLSGARESLTYMKMSPDMAFRCGPMALAYLKAASSPLIFSDPVIHKMLSTDKGTTLAMNCKWAGQIGLNLQMVKRAVSVPLAVPSLVHLRTGHFAAVMACKEGRYLLQDPFLGDVWLTQATLDQEGSGYALIPSGPLAPGVAAVSENEGGTVWGKGAWGPGRPDDTRPDSVKLPTSLALKSGQVIKPAYHADLVSLNLDIPVVSYLPVRGPGVDFTVTYNQREYGQPQLFDYCNLGPKWTFSFLACLKDDSTNPDADVTMCNPGGGGQVFHSNGDGGFRPENDTQARLSRLPGNGYLVSYPGGRQEFYDLADRAWGLRRLVLTHIQDKFGNTVRLTWDAQLRLVAVADACGKTTTIAYEVPKDPLKISRVTDPFGRSTRFQYDGAGMLSGVMDAQGLVTNFAYGPLPENKDVPLDFLRSLATAAGGFTFQGGETLVGPSFRRWIESTGPEGDKERLESAAGYAYEIAPEKLPMVPELDVAYHPLAFRFRESWFWAAGQMDVRKLDYHKAKHLRWGHGPGGFSSGIVLSEKEPTGPHHWFVHAGDFWGGVFQGAHSGSYPLTADGVLKPEAKILNLRGTEAQKDRLAPVFDGSRQLLTRDYWVNAQGTVEAKTREFDTEGRLVVEVDPNGSTTRFTWGGNGDLIKAAMPKDKIAHEFHFDQEHHLLAWRRPDGRTWRATYRKDGQLQGFQEGRSGVWVLAYDDQGRLSAATHGNQVWHFSFDPFDRVLSVQDPRGAIHRCQGLVEPQISHKPDAATNGFDTFGLGPVLRVPQGCISVFASLLGGANGPLISRLMAVQVGR